MTPLVAGLAVLGAYVLGGVPFSLLLGFVLKGIDETNPYAAMAVGYVELAVDASEKELAIDISPSADMVRPGETVSYLRSEYSTSLLHWLSCRSCYHFSR